jgi:hypothetical protein
VISVNSNENNLSQNEIEKLSQIKKRRNMAPLNKMTLAPNKRKK